MNARPYKRQGKRVRQALASLYLFSSLCGAQAGETGQTVQALRYGVTLFHFYQQDYFDALTELMAAQQLEQLDVHADNAELLRGGMSLSYGMDLAAERIFRDLLNQSGDSIDRDQAWFYLGKMAWQRGDPQRAAHALAELSKDYAGDLAPEANYLRASVELRLGDEDAAASYIERLPEDSAWRYYLYYNMGASRAARGDWQSSIQYFHEFDDMPLRAPESKALRDKAFTASGFASMAAGDFEQARDDFTRVRLDSPLSDRALLGYGWAAGQLGDYQAALSPWQTLGERSLLGESARESLLALPYAYEQLGRPGVAMANYRVATDVYTSELAGVRDAIEVFRTGDLKALLVSENDEAGEWLFDADILPRGKYAPYLQHLVSRHGFQVALRELRDLHNVAGHLDSARERLQVLTHVDAQQQQTWASVAQGDRREQLLQRQLVLRQRVEELRQRIDGAAAQGDGRLLADAQQAARWRRLDKATALASRLGVGSQERDRLSLYRGLMLWEDNERYPDRIWRIKRDAQELERLAQHSVVRLQNVDDATAQRRHSNFAPRIVQLEERVRAQLQGVEQAMLKSEAGIRQLAVAELERQAGQLSRSQGQSRLAIARLYDLGSPEIPR